MEVVPLVLGLTDAGLKDPCAVRRLTDEAGLAGERRASRAVHESTSLLARAHEGESRRAQETREERMASRTGRSSMCTRAAHVMQ